MGHLPIATCSGRKFINRCKTKNSVDIVNEIPQNLRIRAVYHESWKSKHFAFLRTEIRGFVFGTSGKTSLHLTVMYVIRSMEDRGLPARSLKALISTSH